MHFYYTLFTFALFSSFTTGALAQSFSDVPSSHYASQSITYLKEQGFVSGYDDGTFRPNQPVNRAEAMKFIIEPITEDNQLASFTTTGYNDIASDAWYLKYVEFGRNKGVVDGPSTKPAFNGGNTIIKAEFLKMLLLAYDIDPNSYSEIKLPLSTDVANTSEWYYPYMRYAVSSSMTRISDQGTLDPGRQLTRGDTAVMLHRLLMYRQNRRNQALLSMAESEINVILGSLENNNIEQAEYASARALLSARGAHSSNPDSPVVLGALKTTEAFRALVRAYRAGLNREFEEVVRLAGDAWNLAAKAKEMNPDIADLAEKIQGIASGMADDARALMGN